MKRIVSVLTVLSLCCAVFAGCAGGDYGKYASAYNKVTANGGMDADIVLTLSIDGSSLRNEGNLKQDRSGEKNIVYYEMNVKGKNIIQFSDGDYIYTNIYGNKIRYPVGGYPPESDSSDDSEAKNGVLFESETFLNEFASFIASGKLLELDLFSPIARAAITNISLSGNTYTLTFSDGLVNQVFTAFVSNKFNDTGEKIIAVTDLRDFTNTVTVSDGIAVSTKYSGVMTVKVPGHLTESGKDTSYDMDIEIEADFIDPGSAVNIILPSTDGYKDALS